MCAQQINAVINNLLLLSKNVFIVNYFSFEKNTKDNNYSFNNELIFKFDVNITILK